MATWTLPLEISRSTSLRRPGSTYGRTNPRSAERVDSWHDRPGSMPNMPGLRRRAIMLAIGILAGGPAGIAGQSRPAPDETREAPRFRIAADGVRIDAVVTD